MKIIICGAGLSGRAIAEKLSQIGNEVTIIDSSKKLIEKLGNKLDIRGIVGHGAHPDILGEAGAEDAEMLISVTPSDEINMMEKQANEILSWGSNVNFKIPITTNRLITLKTRFFCLNQTTNTKVLGFLHS